MLHLLSGQALRATTAHDLNHLAEAEARLKDELAAKAARDNRAQASSSSSTVSPPLHLPVDWLADRWLPGPAGWGGRLAVASC
jgi:hypothetical protein